MIERHLPCSCGIQSLRRIIRPPALHEANLAFDQDSLDAGKPQWRYFGQVRDFYYPLERVCGTEEHVDGMRRNAAPWRGPGLAAAVPLAYIVTLLCLV